MTYLIAAAGTGGHVFPGLAVGEALIELGVAQTDVLFVGGDRLEARVYPETGFRFFGVELAGLQRSLTARNLRIPAVVMRARDQIGSEIERSGVRVALGMGGYVTVPVGMAARRARVPLFTAEQNAHAGLANRVAARWARVSFTSFPKTVGLPGGVWVGNPLRRPFWEFDRSGLAAEGAARYGLTPGRPVVGVFGGSLGARVVNEAMASVVEVWDGPPLQVIHLTGEAHLETLTSRQAPSGVDWALIGFEEQMELFYAVCDLVVARAGGAVAELTATATPSILIPGAFGSGGHQGGNARSLEEAGAAVVVAEDRLETLGAQVARLVSDADGRIEMAAAARRIAKPEAALTIARAMIEASR